jgi:hypothetical protein
VPTTWSFSGPTISPAEVARRHPGYVALPPVEHGDLYRLDARPGDVVVLLDGYFMQRAPIRHKEILDLVDAGVTVVGAASMGALRAAELHRDGMVGAGRVFRFFRAGVLDADDEVTIVHLDEDRGFRPVTEALVNVRSTVTRMVRRGVLSRPDAAVVVEAARTMPFYERHLASIVERSVAAGLSPGVAASFVAGYRACFRDVKSADADDVLAAWRPGAVRPGAVRPAAARHAAARPGAARAAAATRAPSERNVYPYLWRHEESREVPVGAARVGGGQVLACAQGLAVDYETFHERVTRRLVFATLGGAGDAGGTGITPKAVRAAVGRLAPGEDAERFLAGHHLDAADAVALDRCRVAAERAGSEDAGWARTLARYARRLGWFPGGTAGQQDLRQWSTPGERAALTEDELVARMVLRSFAWSPGVLPWRLYAAELKLTPSYRELAELVVAAREFADRLNERGVRRTLSHVSNRRLATWFVDRWDARDAPHARLCDRGFPNTQVLVDRLSPLFPYAYTHDPRPLVGTGREGRRAA